VRFVLCAPPILILVVHFHHQDRCPICLFQVEFYTDASLEEMRLLFTAAAECDPTDVLKLTTRSGRLLKLSAELPANKPNNRYRLHVVAAPVPGTTVSSTLGLVYSCSVVLWWLRRYATIHTLWCLIFSWRLQCSVWLFSCFVSRLWHAGIVWGNS